MPDLDDKTAVVTGAGSGIGAATASLLAKHGAQVVLADIDLAAAMSHAERIRDEGGRALAQRTDVSSFDSLRELLSIALDTFGTVDIFFANAGVGITRGFADDTPEEWRRMFDINLLGAAFSVRAALPELTRSGGHMVLTSSLSGHVVTPSVYSAAKHGVTALAEALRQEADGAIRVTCIKPGLTRTGIFDARAFPEALGDPSLPDALDPDDLARAVVFAVSQPSHVDISEIVVRPRSQRL